MSIMVRDYPGGRKEVDIRFRLPNGNMFRKKLVAPVNSDSGARRWGEARERDLYEKAFRGGGAIAQVAIPTLDRFAPRFIEDYATANQHKPSGIASKQSVIDRHLLPRFGSKRLTEITDADVQKLKADLADRSAKTVNNVLSVLSKMLKVAVDWRVIVEMPVHIRLLKVQNVEMGFYEPKDYDKLIQAAAEMGWEDELLVRLGGDAGLRRGEMIGIRDVDLDLERSVLKIHRNIVGDNEGGTKGLKARRVQITAPLADLLRAHVTRGRGRLLQQADGEDMSAKMLRVRMKHIQQRAGLRDNGGLHILRHTYCSHLAMAGVPVMEIQKLAGHAHLSTTLKYMHLAPGADQSEAVKRLDALRAKPKG